MKNKESVKNSVPVETPAAVIEKKETADIEKKSVPKKKIITENKTVPPMQIQQKKSNEVIAVAVEDRDTEAVRKINKVEKNQQPQSKKSVEKKQVIFPHWIEDFEPDGHINGEKFVDDWRREGGVIFTPKTRFFLRNDSAAKCNSVLVIESKKSSAFFACDLSGKVDLNETPILRWRWKVKKLPPDADGRHRKKDDQAVGIYIGTGTVFNQKAIAYRWETETPVGHWGKTVYSNVMSVRFLCQRNKDNGLDIWYEEERNVRDDFIEQFGFVPGNIALAICGNSQNSQSDALAEIDFIGFYKENKEKK